MVTSEAHAATGGARSRVNTDKGISTVSSSVFVLEVTSIPAASHQNNKLIKQGGSLQSVDHHDSPVLPSAAFKNDNQEISLDDKEVEGLKANMPFPTPTTWKMPEVFPTVPEIRVSLPSAAPAPAMPDNTRTASIFPLPPPAKILSEHGPTENKQGKQPLS